MDHASEITGLDLFTMPFRSQQACSMKSVAGGDCIILFLRQCSDEVQPFYTIEVQGNRAVQVRGMRNSVMTQEVKVFIAAWEKCVLRTRLPAA